DLQGTRDLLMTEAGEMAQLSHLGGGGVLLGEFGNCLIQGNEPVVGRRGRRIDQLNSLQGTATLLTFLAPGVFNQDAAHGLSRGGKEVPSISPALLITRTDHPEIRFMDQGRGLERLPWFFVG